GATGFTGQLVAKHLAREAPEHLRLALAGRSLDKLKMVHASMAAGPVKDKCGFIVGDSLNQKDMERLAEQTVAVISTAGPYAKYGYHLVKACVDQNTHYADLTGEGEFYKHVVSTLHEEAERNGTRIIPQAGFDSVPSDLAVYLLAEEYRKNGQELGATRCSVHKLKASMSGGTIASIAGVKPSGPYGYLTEKERTNIQAVAKPQQSMLSRDPILGGWNSLYVMESIDLPLVFRSAFLNNYGSKFQWSAYRRTPSLLQAIINNLFILAFAVTSGSSILRPLLSYLMPPGSGPSEEAQRSGGYSSRTIGSSPDTEVRYVTELNVNGDPGYSQTAKILGEVGLLLALETDKLKSYEGPIPLKQSGVITASAAFGNVLVDRLKKQGFTFNVSKL
ncbi:hypothetical protein CAUPRSCDRAFT_7613, partial [Caulochytrium protostelioides]